MNKRALITILLGTLLLFIWNAVSWMVLPFHSNTLKNMPQELVSQEQMKGLMPESGVYHYPGLPTEATPENLQQIEQKLKNGPRITMMVYKNEPTELFDPMTYLGSLVINLLTVILAYLLVSRLQLKDFPSILTFSLLMGLVSSIVSDVALLNWYMIPWSYTLVNVMDKLVAFCLLDY